MPPLITNVQAQLLDVVEFAIDREPASINGYTAKPPHNLRLGQHHRAPPLPSDVGRRTGSGSPAMTSGLVRMVTPPTHNRVERRLCGPTLSIVQTGRTVVRGVLPSAQLSSTVCAEVTTVDEATALEAEAEEYPTSAARSCCRPKRVRHA